MLTTLNRVVQYKFWTAAIYLQLNNNGYWTHVSNQSPKWEMNSGVYGCPTQASMAGELLVLQSHLKCDRFPACILSLHKNREIIQATNTLDEQLFGATVVGTSAHDFVLDPNQYQTFLNELKEKSIATAHLKLQGMDGQFLNVETEGTLFKSPVSLFPWAYIRSYNARSACSSASLSHPLNFKSKALALEKLLHFEL
jgi:hypothetical protein